MTIDRMYRSCAALTLIVLVVLLPAGCERKKEAATDTKTETTPADPLAEAKERSKANLKQIARAFNNYETANRVYPTGLLVPTTKRLGLSWRVQLLPYLEDPAAKELYKKFKLGEPWNSDHNMKLLAAMPKVYAPVRGQAAEGHTYYQGFAAHHVDPKGKELADNAPIPVWSPVVFWDARTVYSWVQVPADLATGLPAPGHNQAAIADGGSSTFSIAEAGSAVPWTKPQDIPFRIGPDQRSGEGGTWPKLGGLFDGDFHVAKLDEWVHYIKKEVPADKLRLFITIADGMIPDFDAIGVGQPQQKGQPAPAGDAEHPKETPPSPPSPPKAVDSGEKQSRDNNNKEK